MPDPEVPPVPDPELAERLEAYLRVDYHPAHPVPDPMRLPVARGREGRHRLAPACRRRVSLLDRCLGPAVLLEGCPLPEPAIHQQQQAVLPRPGQAALRYPDLPHQS